MISRQRTVRSAAPESRHRAGNGGSFFFFSGKGDRAHIFLGKIPEL